MIVYKFREYDRAYDGPVEMEDRPSIPKFHTFNAPPEQEGMWPFMTAKGWVLRTGGKPALPEPDYEGEEAARVRQERNKLLAESDWTQLIDSPFSNDSNGVWQAYRQALRDVPNQEGFPFDIEWPQKPE